jgi:hypothetical protein
MPSKLRQDENRLEVLRAANSVAGVVEKRPYTDVELQEALFETEKPVKRGHTVLRSTGDDIWRRYGVGISTLRRLTKSLREANSILGRNTWADETTLRAAMPIKKSGPAPLFWPAEGALFAQRTGLLGGLARGETVKAQQAALSRVQREMGEQLLSEVGQENMNPKDALQINKLLSSKGSRKQLVSVKTRALQHKLSPPVTEEKPSNLSASRAQAHDPKVIDAMFKRFTDFTSGLFHDKKISKPNWENSQLYFGDELGCDPDGKISSVATFAHAKMQLAAENRAHHQRREGSILGDGICLGERRRHSRIQPDDHTPGYNLS